MPVVDRLEVVDIGEHHGAHAIAAPPIVQEAVLQAATVEQARHGVVLRHRTHLALQGAVDRQQDRETLRHQQHDRYQQPERNGVVRPRPPRTRYRAERGEHAQAARELGEGGESEHRPEDEQRDRAPPAALAQRRGGAPGQQASARDVADGERPRREQAEPVHRPGCGCRRHPGDPCDNTGADGACQERARPEHQHRGMQQAAQVPDREGHAPAPAGLDRRAQELRTDHRGKRARPPPQRRARARVPGARHQEAQHHRGERLVEQQQGRDIDDGHRNVGFGPVAGPPARGACMRPGDGLPRQSSSGQSPGSSSCR